MFDLPHSATSQSKRRRPARVGFCLFFPVSSPVFSFFVFAARLQPYHTPKNTACKEVPEQAAFPQLSAKRLQVASETLYRAAAGGRESANTCASTHTKTVTCGCRQPKVSSVSAEKTTAVNFSLPRFDCTQPTKSHVASEVCQGNISTLLLQFRFRPTAPRVQGKRLIKGTSLRPFAELMDLFLVVHFPTLSGTRLFW